MRLSFKWLRVPATNETRTVEAVQLWEVRWTSRNGIGHSPDYVSSRVEAEFFTSEEEARAFAESLRNSFALLRYAGTGTDVEIKKGAGA